MFRSICFLIPIILVSCVKEPGIGGRGEIHGLVLEQRYDDGVPVGEPYPIPEQDVFIVYGDGDGETSDDDVSTGADGRFRVIIVPHKDKWPEGRFIRQGTRLNAWILLNNVPLGFELWRQFNGFPPTMPD